MTIAKEIRVLRACLVKIEPQGQKLGLFKTDESWQFLPSLRANWADDRRKLSPADKFLSAPIARFRRRRPPS